MSYEMSMWRATQEKKVIEAEKSLHKAAREYALAKEGEAMASSCFLCGCSEVHEKLLTYMRGTEITKLCEDVLKCKGIAAMKSSTAHLIRQNHRPISTTPPERDRRTDSTGGD